MGKSVSSVAEASWLPKAALLSAIDLASTIRTTFKNEMHLELDSTNTSIHKLKELALYFLKGSNAQVNLGKHPNKFFIAEIST